MPSGRLQQQKETTQLYIPLISICQISVALNPFSLNDLGQLSLLLPQLFTSASWRHLTRPEKAAPTDQLRNPQMA